MKFLLVRCNVRALRYSPHRSCSSTPALSTAFRGSGTRDCCRLDGTPAHSYSSSCMIGSTQPYNADTNTEKENTEDMRRNRKGLQVKLQLLHGRAHRALTKTSPPCMSRTGEDVEVIPVATYLHLKVSLSLGANQNVQPLQSISIPKMQNDFRGEAKVPLVKHSRRRVACKAAVTAVTPSAVVHNEPPTAVASTPRSITHLQLSGRGRCSRTSSHTPADV
jgi:hypothetical protein